MIVKLLTEHNLEILSLKGGCRGSSESTLIKMPNCWKSHVLAHIYIVLAFQIHLLSMLLSPLNLFNTTYLKKVLANSVDSD